VRIAYGRKENGIVIGNAYNKYASTNPIVRRIMRGFTDSLDRLVTKIHPRSIHEVGCGEGFWVIRWFSEGYDVVGSDFSEDVIELARTNGVERGLPPDRFYVKSIYELSAAADAADLVVCCEVMEHLDDPQHALSNLREIVIRDLIISVPREPIWRILNVARGKYISDLGNTPGHIQHWSKNGIVRQVETHFTVSEIVTPLPWTMLHCRAKD